jgi:hypothetical protein
MKSLLVILSYIATYVLVFIVLSSIGLLITNNSFSTITQDVTWFMCYTIFIGWWVGIPVAMEVSNTVDCQFFN